MSIFEKNQALATLFEQHKARLCEEEGLTEEEIRSYFGDYIEDASQILRMKPSDVMQALRRNYDGYCFDDKVSSHVYTPWSVLNFLNCPGDGFRNYWFETGGISSSLINYFKSHALRDPAEFQDPVTSQLKTTATANFHWATPTKKSRQVWGRFIPACFSKEKRSRK